MGGMGGMIGGGRIPNLKNLDPEDRVQTITYCKDTYTITTANGQTRKFWERNLRLKDRFERRRTRKKRARLGARRNDG
jgi:cytochrome c